MHGGDGELERAHGRRRRRRRGRRRRRRKRRDRGWCRRRCRHHRRARKRRASRGNHFFRRVAAAASAAADAAFAAFSVRALALCHVERVQEEGLSFDPVGESRRHFEFFVFCFCSVSKFCTPSFFSLVFFFLSLSLSLSLSLFLSVKFSFPLEPLVLEPRRGVIAVGAAAK